MKSILTIFQIKSKMCLGVGHTKHCCISFASEKGSFCLLTRIAGKGHKSHELFSTLVLGFHNNKRWRSIVCVFTWNFHEKDLVPDMPESLFELQINAAIFGWKADLSYFTTLFDDF